MFDDRRDAGRKLAAALEAYACQGVLVLAIPRGGVEVGYQVARALGADFCLVIVRKLPYPDNPEAGFGAVAEDGSVFVFERAASWLSRQAIQEIIEEQKAEVKRRIAVLRGGRPLPPIEDRTVILVDDGIAMGSTMRVAISLCKNRSAGEIVVASPVASSQMAGEMGALADRAIILETPPLFRAVAEVYRRWYDVPDREVLAIMQTWREERATG
jgi:putative phosphoribosyl transferase